MKPDHAKGRGPNPSDRAMERLEELGKTDLPMFRFNPPSEEEPDTPVVDDPVAETPVEDVPVTDVPGVPVDEDGVPIFDFNPDADENWDFGTPDADLWL